MRALAALAIVVAAALAALALVTFAQDDSVTTEEQPVGSRVVVLRQGDRVLMPAVAAECLATQEGGSPRLHCSRTSRGRYQVDIFADTVHLYDLEAPNAEPMMPTYSVPATTRR